jgi:TolB protein
MPAAGGPSVQLTYGTGPDDGSEFSTDGRWIYFNTESFSKIAGHAQIARVFAAGGDPEQLTFNERVNWFPHLSPDGGYATYLS